MKERLRTLMQIYSINQTELAQKIGVSKMTISHIMSDTGRGGGFKQETIDAIKRAFPTVDINWLITGVGTAPLPIDETSLFGQPAIVDREVAAAPQRGDNMDSENDTPGHPNRLESSPLDLNEGNTDNKSYIQPNIDVVSTLIKEEGREGNKGYEPERKPVEKQITRIVLFYSDGTFKDYRPE